MAAPSIRSVGAVASGTASVTVNLPASWQENDILVIVASTANQDFPTDPPTGWSNPPTTPTGFGTAGAAGGLKLKVYWKRAGASESNVVLGDAGSYSVARMMAIQGAVTSGTPWETDATSNQTSANTTVTWSSLTTSGADRLIVGLLGGDRDAASTADVGTPTNSNLSSLGDAGIENWVTSGAGGGIYAFTGVKDAAGSTGTTTASITSQVWSQWIGALVPDLTQSLTPSLFDDSTDTFYAPQVNHGLTQGTRFDSATFEAYAATVSSSGGAQDLTQGSRYDNTEGFYAPTVSAGAVTLTPSLYSNVEAFYAVTLDADLRLTVLSLSGVPSAARPFTDKPAASGDATLLPSLVTNDQSWYAPTVTASYTLTPARYDGGQVFYAPTVAPGPVTLGPARYDNAQAFFAPTVAPGAVTLQPARHDNAGAFYGHVVTTGPVTLAPARYDNTSSYYSPTVTRGAVTLSPARYDNSEAFYSPTVTGGGAITLTQASRLDNSQTFYAATLTAGAVTLQPALYEAAQAFYAPTVTAGAVTLSATRLDNSGAFYAHTVTSGAATLTQASRFDNSNGFYAATVTTGAVTLTASRFDNTASLYVPTVTASYTALPGLYTDPDTFYGPTVTPSNALTAARYDNTAAFYQHTLTGGSALLLPPLFENQAEFYQHRLVGGASEEASGGSPAQYARDFERQTLRLRKREEEDERAREIAALEEHLVEQGALERLSLDSGLLRMREIAARYDDLQNRVLRAVEYAERARSERALELAMRELRRVEEAEEIALLMTLALED